MDLLRLGKILKTKGLKGTVKVNSTTDFALERYQEGNKVILKNEKTNEMKEVTASDYYFSQGFDYVTFEELPSIEAITPYIGWEIYVDKETLPELEEGEYYFSDLKGCEVFENNTLIGKVIEVEDFAGRRSLRIQRKGKKDLLLPFIDAFINEVDIESKRINVSLIEGMND